MTKLHISSDLSLPIDAVTQTFSILGIRGSGKTNTAVAIAEEMQKQGQQTVVIDPTNAWYGIRSSKDGKEEGFKVIVMGGENGDLPLDGTSGVVLADFVVESGASVVFSLRHLSMNDQRRFAQDFAERLYFLKGKSENRTPLHLFVDEADEFIPQRIPHGFERMFGAFDRLVRRGRSSGIGLTMISQRPQVLNKDTLSQIETLICHRLLHKLDRKAVKEGWVEGHDSADRGKEFMDSLASLGKGDTWVWSPEWLDIFKRVHVRERETFDSSFTPKAGERVKTAKKLAPVDLDALKVKLAATIEKVKAEDPAELKKRIKELEAQILKAPKSVATPGEVKFVPDYEFTQRVLDQAQKFFTAEFHSYVSNLDSKIMELARSSLDEINEKFAATMADIKRMGATSHDVKMSVLNTKPTPPIIIQRPNPSVQVSSSSNGDMTGPEQRILNAIAWLNTVGVEQPEQAAVAFLAGYTIGGGAFNNPRGRLNQRGLVVYLPGDRIQLTEQGAKVAQTPAAPLNTSELQRMILDRLPGPERKILSALIESPEGLSNEELASRAGYAGGGGAYNNPRGRLRSMGLIYYQDGKVVPKSLMFLDY